MTFQNNVAPKRKLNILDFLFEQQNNQNYEVVAKPMAQPFKGIG